MQNDTTAIQAAPEQRIARPSASFGTRGIVIAHFDELVRFADTVSKSGLSPKGMDAPQAIFVAIQMGMEVGLSPMAALQNVAVVNGRPTLWGDAQLAVARGTGEMEVFEEWFEVGGVRSSRNPSEYKDDTAAVCLVKRNGGKEIESAFSVADAKRAGLWGKAGPWTQYPFRMLRNRARSFALRDAFGDALKGFRSTEEAQDADPVEQDVTPKAEASKLFKPRAEKPKSPVVEAEEIGAVEKENSTVASPDVPVSNPASANPREEVSKLVSASAHSWPDLAATCERNGLISAKCEIGELTPDECVQIVRLWPSILKVTKKGGLK